MGYRSANGRIVIGQPVPAIAGPCEPFLDGMRTCSIRELDGDDTVWVNTLVRHERVYSIDVQAHAHDLRPFYNDLVAMFGEVVSSSFGPRTTALYWNGRETMSCARVVPGSASEANGQAELQMWDAREEGGCRFE